MQHPRLPAMTAAGRSRRAPPVFRLPSPSPDSDATTPADPYLFPTVSLRQAIEIGRESKTR